MSGIVYLVGAGPGDYKLITLKGKECIEKADVIVYDYLADAKLLRWARPEAEIIYAGKQVNRHTLKQEEINALLVEKGLEGKVVARLKGGDPLVFGRGGEEALALKEAGIPFEIVPGVTSGIAAPAYAGIPVTHRAVATSFAIVTGHEDPSKDESGINWEGLATSVDTISFVMGVGNLPYITKKLISCGRSKETPAAIIRWGTKGNQEVVVTTLEKAVDDADRANIKPPAIFIVGEVVELRKDLQWFDNKPLFGKRVVVTRARAQASKVVEMLEELGADVIESPAIRTEALSLGEEEKEILRNLGAYRTIIFTSAQGVAYFFDALEACDKDARALGDLTICSIGVATAKALKEKGLLADVIPVDYQAESVVTALAPMVREGERVLLIQPKVARTVIQEGLAEAGAIVDTLRLYETKQDFPGREVLKEALDEGTVDYITFTSSSTVTNTLKLLGSQAKELLKKAKIVCIGPITAATCLEHDIEADLIGNEFTISAMVDLICKDVEGGK